MFRLPAYFLFCLLFQIFIGVGSAQTIPVRPRITEAPDESRLITLKGNTHPLALAQFDRGAAPPGLPMDRMQLVLTRSAQQETDLKALLDTQQDNSSASFHKWLTPEQFGQQFGPADQDVQVISSWLQSHGFQVNRVANARTVIEFSGTADLVRNAFHTEIHKFVVNGEEHWANASDPQIPQALAPVVAGVATLHNFRPKPLFRISDRWPKVPTKSGWLRPQYNEDDGSRALAPGDYAVIYNIKPLYQAGINGSGVTIGVLGVAPILMQDIADFRQVFGLPKNPPQVIVNGTTPDYFQMELDQFGPDVEGTLDVSWAGAIAPNAAIKFILASDTDTTDGLSLSEEYAVDNNAADILTESFGRCESEINTTANAALGQLIKALREQAAAQGITWVVSSGDSGPYACYGNSPGPLTVNILASSPYVVAVGGTEFLNVSSTHFAAKNNAKTLASALSYPPEEVWNDSCSVAQCGAGNAYVGASSGGVSKLFAKPSWQSGVPGIPSDGARDIPDLSLSASANIAPYLICWGGGCDGGPITSSSFMPIGGTSASAPSFAGIMALVNQKMQSRQGQANYVLYRLAASEQYGKCDGSDTDTPPDSACVFNDITYGNNAVPGEPEFGKPDALYRAGVGYDLTTGLGSVNAANLVNNWGSVSFNATSTTLALNPGTLTHGAPANVEVSVAPQRGSGTPTGDVSLGTTGVAGYGSFPLNNGSVASTLASLPGGTYSLHAHYGGDSAFAPSDSAAVPVTVTPEASTATAGALYFFDVPGALYSGGPYGNVSLALSARVAGLSGQGTATGKVTFTDNGKPVGGGNGVLNTESQAISFNTNIVFPAGQHPIVASYAGDASFQPSISPPVNITITPAKTATTVQTSVSQAESGKQVTLMATVEAGDSQFGDPETGTVTFLLNGKPLGTRSLGANFDFNTNLSNAIALLHTATLPPGTNTITATYGGDGNYVGSSSQPLVVKVVPQAPVCLVTNFTADPNPITLYDPPGATTINVTAPCPFDVRTGSPHGPRLGSGKGTFTQFAQINGGTTFYLQQAGNTTAQGTLQKLTVGVQSGALPCLVLTFAATPSPIISPTLMGTTTITAVVFTAVAACNFDVREGAPNGNLLGSGDQGILVKATSDSVTNGTQFFLQQKGNKTPQGTLATLTVPVLASAPQGDAAPQGSE